MMQHLQDKYLFDTDVLIDWCKGLEKARSMLYNHWQSGCVSTITVAELYVGIRNEQEEKNIQQLLGCMIELPVDTRIAKRAGELRRKYYRSHNISLADAIIAATAELHNLELKTLNTKHYPMFTKLVPAYVKA